MSPKPNYSEGYNTVIKLYLCATLSAWLSALYQKFDQFFKKLIFCSSLRQLIPLNKLAKRDKPGGFQRSKSSSRQVLHQR